MIEGVIHHITEMEIDRQYVDSHGQSEVAFAFCRLLGFALLPRLKAIHFQRLYRPDAGKAGSYKRLEPVLTRPIDWDLMRRQYDQMVKYATALRLGTAQTESILRRFTRNNVQQTFLKQEPWLLRLLCFRLDAGSHHGRSRVPKAAYAVLRKCRMHCACGSSRWSASARHGRTGTSHSDGSKASTFTSLQW